MKVLNSRITPLFIALSAAQALTCAASSEKPLSISNWTYVQVDDQKAKWGDFDSPDWLCYFGLDLADVDGDGNADILTGRNLYMNPGDKMEGDWEKLDLGRNVDGVLFLDTSAGDSPVIIAEALPQVWEFTYTGDPTSPFNSRIIGEVPATKHRNGQGFRVADMIPGGTEEILLSCQGGIYMLERTQDGMADSRLLGKEASDEGFAVGDIDGDGDLDLACGYLGNTDNPQNPREVVWFENPGDGSDYWKHHYIGETLHAVDRVECADLDGDGRMDICVAEERYPGLEPDGSLWVYLQGKDRWERKKIVTQYSMNNLDTADIDQDGDIDLITSEHKGPDLSLQIWQNDGRANFSLAEVDRGKESHLGAKTYDMDRDGDLDIVSIGWDRYNYVHLWRNDAY